MSDFWAIYKAQMLTMLANGKNRRKKKAQKAASFAGYASLWLLVLAIAGVYEFIYAEMFASIGALDVFPVVIMAAASLLTLFSGLSQNKNLLFCAKDHDLLFSLPVPGRTIIAAKLAALYTADMVLSLLILLPCGIFYSIFAEGASLPHYLLAAFFVPMLPILLSSVLSALISFVASRFRRTNIVGTILYTAFFVVWLVGIYSTSFMEDEELFGMFWSLSDKITGVYVPAKWFVNSFIGNRELSSLLLFLGVSIAAFLIIIFVFGKFYGKLHDAFSRRAVSVRYQASSGQSSVSATLIRKDFRRYFASGGLLLNQVTGSMILVVFTILIFLKGDALATIEGDTQAEVIGILTAIAPYVYSMFSVMSCCTNVAISLEGKTMGLLKSLPVSADTILSAKLRFHLIMNLPLVGICSALAAIRLQFPLVNAILMIATPCLFSYLVGVVGLLINLKKYNFNWTNEVMVAKNSFPVGMTILGGFGVGLLLTGLSVFCWLVLGDLSAYVMGFGSLVVLTAVTILLRRLLAKRGEAWFTAIES